VTPDGEAGTTRPLTDAVHCTKDAVFGTLDELEQGRERREERREGARREGVPLLSAGSREGSKRGMCMPFSPPDEAAAAGCLERNCEKRNIDVNSHRRDCRMNTRCLQLDGGTGW
jgi:hypothetical protein